MRAALNRAGLHFYSYRENISQKFMTMKKKNIYLILLIVFAASIAAIIYNYSVKNKTKNPETYAFLPRTGEAAKSPEWQKVKEDSYTLFQKLKADPNDSKSMVSLATMYIREARVTANYAYYDKAALATINKALQINPQDFEALTLQSLVYLSQHHFQDGLSIAEKAKAINPYNSFVYGLCVDGNVETGNYKDAVANADQMLSIRPDMRSYARASYLREIYGDYPGAVRAMQMAVEAGSPGDEGTEWSRVELGQLFENTGDMQNAKMHYAIALERRPGYPYALAGLARIAASEKNYGMAMNYYTQADSAVTDFKIKEGMVDLYNEMGEPANAVALEKKIIEAMTNEAQSVNNDQNIGHYVDKELAYAYLKINDYDNALSHALLEYNRRPDNIDVNECVAWVYYSKGDYEKALPYIKVALKTNSKNPVLLCRAGLIYAKAGEKVLAKTVLQEGLQKNANIETILRNQSTTTLQSL